MRTVGTIVRGIRCPIFQPGDDLVDQIIDALLASCSQEHFNLRDHDVLGITESVVARTQGNYVTIDQIAQDIRAKFPGGELGITFPILSRNRFAVLLRALAMGVDKLHLLFSYPADEVGNHLMDPDALDETQVNPHTDVFNEARYRELFGAQVLHPFTRIDYVDLYKEIIGPDKAEMHFGNDVRAILPFTRHVLTADVHSRARSKRLLRAAGAETVLGLDDICTMPVEPGAGYNQEYGLLGSNKADNEKVKLFPRDCQPLVEKLQRELLKRTGKCLEVMVYGDGAFKDPVGKIWELADPVVSPGFTAGLQGTTNELKLKYLADEMLKDTQDADAVKEAVRKKLLAKPCKTAGNEESLGTTPRRLTDLLGSLCDLASGSGDKGTPVVLVQGYFDCMADD